MSLTNFQLSSKTKRPACCDFYCCGNKFGRIERSQYCKVHHGINRIKRSRRYAKHVEKQLVKKEIEAQLQEKFDSMMEAIKEWNDFWSDCDDDDIDYGFEDYLIHSRM